MDDETSRAERGEVLPRLYVTVGASRPMILRNRRGSKVNSLIQNFLSVFTMSRCKTPHISVLP